MHDLPDVVRVLERLPERVDRNAVREVVLSELGIDHVLPAFAPVMVWGYGTAGYGPARVRWVLTGVQGRAAFGAPVVPTVAERLRAAVETVRTCGAVEAFRFLNNEGHIKHLGGAFFTKWLYFASALNSPDDRAAAPILDKQVRDWLAAHASISLDVYSTASYKRYVEILTAWGDSYERSPSQVEKAIFELATERS